MFIEWISEDSIFIVNVEQYVLRSIRKQIYSVYFYVDKFWRGEEKRRKYAANAALKSMIM